MFSDMQLTEIQAVWVECWGAGGQRKAMGIVSIDSFSRSWPKRDEKQGSNLRGEGRCTGSALGAEQRQRPKQMGREGSMFGQAQGQFVVSFCSREGSGGGGRSLQ